MIKQIPALLNLKSYKSVYALVSSYIKNEKLRRLLSMHPLLVGGEILSRQLQFMFDFILRKEMGNSLFNGRTGQINGLGENLMEEENIEEIIRDNEVQNIIVTNSKINGLKLKERKKKLKADNIICNADPPAVYSKLVNSKNTSPLFNWRK